MTRFATFLAFGIAVGYHAAPALAATVIDADKAAVRTEGGPVPGGGWNLWSNGRVGQPLRIGTGGTYQVSVRAWGSPAAGVWPQMAFLVDGRPLKTVTVDKADRTDYQFQADLTAGTHEIAVAFLNDAVVGKEDRNLYLARITVSPPAGAAEPTPADPRELAEAAERHEEEIVAGTQAAIEKHRKADARVRIVDSAGRPVPGVKVAVEQTGHEFLFGCNIYGFDRLRSDAKNAAYKKRFEELFNYATVGFYWRSYEPRQGQPNYEYTDRVVEWCRQRSIRMKGHPLLWGNKAGIPPWSDGQPSPQLQRQRVEDIMSRYQGRIQSWEVVNEPAHLAEPKIDEPYRWAHEVDPRAYLIVNDYQVLADGCPRFFQLLTAAEQEGVPFNGIGIQAHEPRTMRFPLDRVQETLDRYASLHKELHITEFTPTSGGQKITGSHREGVWDEAAQADYALKFYRLCFAHPAVRAITWWDLSDQGSWQPGGGMLRADMSPKPVYEQLQRLIHQQWKTRLDTATDADGRFAFRGYCGTYRLVIDLPEGKAQRQFRLAKRAPQEIDVVVPAAANR